jgi:predicted transcriptional regulator
LGKEIKEVEDEAEEVFKELCVKHGDHNFNLVHYILNRFPIKLRVKKRIKDRLIATGVHFYLYQRWELINKKVK